MSQAQSTVENAVQFNMGSDLKSITKQETQDSYGVLKVVSRDAVVPTYASCLEGLEQCLTLC